MSYSLRGYEYKFYPEAMSNDFNGIESNGKIILCYGNNGIILRTTDNFSTMQQINIGYNKNILKIIYYNNNFYGITETSFLKSLNNGTNWIEIPTTNQDTINDINIYNNQIYVLKRNGCVDVYELDFRYLGSYTNADSTIINPNSLFIHNNNIYYLDYSNYLNEFILRFYNYNTFDKKIINFYYKDSNKPIKFQKIKGFYDTGSLLLFLKDYYVFPTSVILEVNLANMEIKDILKSTKSTALIQQIARNNGYLYTISGDSVYFPKICRIVSVGDTAIFEQVNISPLDKYLNQTHKISSYLDELANSVNDIKFINEDVIVVVGKNKFIAISKDKGKNWQLISYFPQNNITLLAPSKSNYSLPQYNSLNNTLFYYPNNEFFRTSNNGLTWLTQKNNQQLNTINPYIKRQYVIDSLGNIYIFIQDSSQKIFYSDDNGATFKAIDSKTDITDFTFTYFKENLVLGLKIKSYFQKNSFDTTLIKVYDIKSQKVDSTKLYNFYFIKPIIVNKEIFLLGFERTNWSDENPSYYRRIKLCIYKSKNGIEWDIVKNNIDINTFLTNEIYQGVKLQLFSINNVYYWKNKIFFTQSFAESGYIPNLDKSLNKLYIFDLENNALDSLDIPDFFNNSSLIGNADIFLTIKDNLFLLCQNMIYKINYNKYLIEDSLLYQQLIPDWINYDVNQAKGHKIFYSKETNDYLWIFLVKFDKFRDQIGNFNYFQKIIPVRYPICNIVKVEDKIEQINKRDVYLYNDAPYPIPSNDIISAVIYWNNKYDINTAIFEVYNIYGERIKDSNISIEQLNNFSAKINLECSNLPSGTYFLQVKLGEEQKSIPIIINR